MILSLEEYNTYYVRLLFFILAILSPILSLGQLTSPGSNAVRYTAYPSSPSVKDPLFIFCNPAGTPSGSLNAARPRGSGAYDFYWYQWSNVTGSFSMNIRNDPGVSASSASGLAEGGYKVDIHKNGIFDTSLVGWIAFDKPPVAVARLANRTCYYVALDGEAAATVPVFNYYDPVTGAMVGLQNGVSALWSSSPNSVIPFPELRDPITYTPPLEDVTYTFRVNSTGCSNDSSFFYESIHVNADFSIDPADGDAPLDVTFTDRSVRGTKKYIWDFGDKTRDGKEIPDWVVTKDSLWLFENPFIHTYYFPGEYSVKLTIESEYGCADSLRLETKIKVEDSKLNVPNVFTPDGDGFNDFFLVDAASLKFINIEIFSRGGLKVYSFTGDGERLKEWPGWDGHVNSSSVKAGPGVYFYIIRAVGWDDIEYDSKLYRGVLYLYR